MTDVDQALRAHAATAATAELDPAAWDRIVERLDEVDTGGIDHRAPRRRWSLMAAAAVVAVLAAAALVATRALEDDTVRTSPGDDTTTAPPTSEPPTINPSTEPSTTTAPPPVEPGPHPTSAVVLSDVDGDGLADLARLDGLGPGPTEGEVADPEITVLVASVADEVEAGSSTVSATDVGPDGTTYYEACCEPAVGEVMAIGPDGGEPRLVTYGQVPSISADGARLAVSDQTLGVRVVDPVDGTTQAELGLPDPDGGFVSGLTWSPDGSRLAAEVTTTGPSGIDGVYVAVREVEDADGAWRRLDDGGAGWAMPAFLADGRLVVGTDASFLDDGFDLVATGMSVVDLDTGSSQWRFGGVPLRSIDATSDGRWLVASDGVALRAFSGDDLHDAGTVGQVDGPVFAVSW